MYIVIQTIDHTVSIKQGIYHIGPFNSREDAVKWVELNHVTGYSSEAIVKLQPA